MIVYQFPVSHYCEKTRWTLDAKGIHYTVKNLFPGAHKSFLRARGGRALPALQHDGAFVADSRAIGRYLEERFALPALLPADETERRAAIAWGDHFDVELGPAVRLLAYSYLLERPPAFVGVFFGGYPALLRLWGTLLNKPIRRAIRKMYRIDDGSRVRAQGQVFAAMARLEERLGQRRSEFLFGDALSLADITTAALLSPLLMPSESPYHAVTGFPPPLIALREELRETPAAAEYRKALEELDPLVKQADKYYDQKDYKDDKMAKGKAMHLQLINAFAKFEQVSKGFEDRVTTLNDQVNTRQFGRLEKDAARRLQYLSQKSLNEGKALIKLTDIAELKELDLQKYDVAVQNYDKSLTELEQYADSHKAEVDKAMMFSSYLSSAKTFLKSAKELLRRKRDNKDFNKEFFSKSSPNLVDGHPAQVVETYNRMIGDSNNLRY